jgi:hypothetical protein
MAHNDVKTMTELRVSGAKAVIKERNFGFMVVRFLRVCTKASDDAA